MEKEPQDKQRALSSGSLGTLFIRYAWILFATIHFTASFFYERKILKFSDTSWDFFWSIALDDRVSNRQQSMILYFFSKIVAAVLISLMWYLIFTKKKCNVVCMCLATLFLIQFFIITFTMPNVLSLYFYSVLYPMLLLEALCVFEKVSRNLSGKPVNNKSQ